jgi:hypothetical protein
MDTMLAGPAGDLVPPKQRGVLGQGLGQLVGDSGVAEELGTVDLGAQVERGVVEVGQAVTGVRGERGRTEEEDQG